MKQLDRTKVCWNCTADVSDEATYCPFCAADLLTKTTAAESSPPPQDDMFSQQTLQDSLASLYKPPYSMRNKQGVGVPDEREETSFTRASPPKEDPLFQPYETVTPVASQGVVQEQGNMEEQSRGNVWPLLLLSVGAHLVLLGLLILFCSKEGRVVLEWNSRYWLVYSLIGTPLLFLGVRKLKKDTLRQIES